MPGSEPGGVSRPGVWMIDPMGCGCQERAASIKRTVKAAKQGDGQAVAAEAKFIMVSAVQDVASTFRDKTAAARVKLTMRSKR